ncbi:hypothetical protein DBR32_03785 [Taibaiella sp. KBW10]|uniref:acyltransferase family protein n=1 Tax=Taibaiella sp. KBW10 TaxID=2153357 RepID=UPI000F5B1A6A|nr:acyltransferase [Taibaiella sp. KBW10]RQO31937.1 hypothetical protein DBR32_03785 [Taibaiella sp. KBW10]
MASSHSKSGFFFNGLNELRAFAALAVLFHHIEMLKFKDGIISLFDYKISRYFIENVGKNGVYLFFVLSGFLITFLLLKEKAKTGTILFKNFYLRRIFRIWPLYYIILLISFVIIPLLNQSFAIFSDTSYYFNRLVNEGNYRLTTILLYVSFLPNVALQLGTVLVGCSQSWSVGVEEQFYIIWPFLIYFFSKKKILGVFFGILILFILFNLQSILPIIKFVTSIFPFEFMAIGSIGGFIYFYYKEHIELISNNKYVYLLCILGIIFLLAVPVLGLYIQNVLLAFLFLALIIISVNDSNPLAYRNRVFSFLGKISYGIYMYHSFLMFLIFPIVAKLLPAHENIIIYNVLLYFLLVTSTILISHLSYKYIETYFIKIKDTRFKSI